MTVAIGLLSSATSSHAAITLDGIRNGSDTYANSSVESWYNGHKPEFSIYGDATTPLGTTKVYHGIDILAGDASGTQYFFAFIEVPLYAKNMIWEDQYVKFDTITNTDPLLGLVEEDVTSYRTQHETHHPANELALNFQTAIDSEKAILNLSSDNNKFEAKLKDGGSVNDGFNLGLINFSDSLQYLLSNNLATQALSLNREQTLSFEFQFAVDATKNQDFLDLFDNHIEFHLSPERGLPIPEPGALTLLGLSGLLTLRRRR